MVNTSKLHEYHTYICKITQKSALIANIVKGAVSGLGQFLATESRSKMIKIAFYFTLKARTQDI